MGELKPPSPLSYNSAEYKPQFKGQLRTAKILMTMKHAQNYVQMTLRMLTLAAAMALPNAYADDYAEVSQLMRAGKFSEAMNKAEQYLSAKPRDPQMRFLKGVIQRDTGKTAEALSTFTRLTEDYPELPEPYNNLAVLYAGQSQFDKARAALEMAIRTNPSYSTAHENLGDVYAKLASQAYNKALQLDANNQAVAPKLALIRELFNPGARGQKPSTSAPTPTTAPVAPTGNITSALAQKPPPTLPGPAISAGKTSNVPSSVALGPVNGAANNSTKTPPTVTPTPVTPVATPESKPETKPTTAPEVPEAKTAKEPAPHNNNKDVQTAVLAWADAWSDRNVKEYLASYGRDFATPGSMSRSEWEAERRQRITSKAKISVKLENLNITSNGNKATAKFRQDYKANGISKFSRKTLELVKSGDRWLIVKETVAD